MSAYLRTGSLPEALILILMKIIERTPGGGATMDELKNAYEEARDTQPSEKTIYRSIKRINLLFDPLAYENEPDRKVQAPDAEEEEEEWEEIESYPLTISMEHDRNFNKRFIFTGSISAGRIEANQALLMILGLYNQQRGLLKDQFKAVIKVLLKEMRNEGCSGTKIFHDMERHIHASGHGPSDPQKTLLRLKEIMRAIDSCKRIKLEYLRTYDGALKLRTVEPYGILCRLNSWYLVAFCVQQQKRRVYLLDHIKRLKVDESSIFKRPEGFSLKRIYGNSWGIWNPDDDEAAEPETVRIIAAKGVAERFKTVSYHDSQKVTALPNGEAEITFEVTGAEEMISWLMSWGAAVRLLEPAWLQKKLLETMKNAMDAYIAP